MTDFKNNSINLKRFAILVMAGYIILTFIFYYLAGYQLHYRNSRGNLEMGTAEGATVELCQGVVVEQTFITGIQRLQEVSVQWGTYYRENYGTALMELYNAVDGSLLMSKTFNVHDIPDCGFTTISSNKPIEGLYNIPLVIRISADSVTGSAASPLMTASAANAINNGEQSSALTINGQAANGTLCFSATGEDYIWTGLHYWELAAGLGVALIVYLVFVYLRSKHGKRSTTVTALVAMKKYSFLMKQLVNRDFKAKYKRSILGVLWSFLNPLLNMIVQYLVFSNMFKFDIPYFPVYLLCGNVIFNYFSESCGMALSSIIGNAGLITKVYMPKYIYPLTRIISSLINLVISMIPLLVVTLFSGLAPSKAYLLLPFPLLCLAMFCLGLGMLLAAAMVFFRDIQFLWGVLTTVWMYLTPIFYPVSALPENIQAIVRLNPLYYYVTFVRTCVIDGVSPEPTMYVQCFLIALAMLAVGALIFKKTQDHFVLYL